MPLATLVTVAALALTNPPPQPLPAPTFAWQGDAFVADEDFAARLREAGSFSTSLVVGGEAILVRCEPLEIVDSAIDVRIGTGRRERDGTSVADAVRAMRQWRGSVEGEPGSVVHLAVSNRGVAGLVDRGPGRGRFAIRQVEGDRPGLQAGLVRFDRAGGISQPDVPLCGTEELPEGGVAGKGGGIPPGVVKTIDLAVDSDFEFYGIFGDPIDAAEYVAALYGAVSAIYRRDVEASIKLVYLRLADDPDDLFNDPDPLVPFRNWWNENQGDVQRDLAHLLTGRRNLPYGGVAWLNSTCGSNGYAVNGYLIGRFADPDLPHPGNWDVIVVAHELGHNVGSLHTHSYGLDSCDSGEVRRGSIMSYCHVNSGATANVDLEFHVVSREAMRSYLADSCVKSDCDGDGVPDAEAIALGLSQDVDGDGIPDECQDCDGDGLHDPTAIALGLVSDLDGDGRPDSCQPDCNKNGIPDSLDIAEGRSFDLFGNGIPDECEADCDGDGLSDYTNIQWAMERDRSRDARLDECEDCDGDGVPDFIALEGSIAIWVGRAGESEVRELHPRSGLAMSAVPLVGGPAYDLAIGPDGYLYAAAGNVVERIDRIARRSLGAVATLAGDTLRGIAFAADGSLVVATGDGRLLRVDVATGTIAALAPQGLLDDPRDVLVRGDGTILVSCGDATVRRFAADGSGGAVFLGPNFQIADPHGLFETPDAGRILVVGREQRAIYAYDGATGAALGRFDVQPGSLLNDAWGLAASADGRAVLATGASSSSTVNGYRLATGYLERTYRVYPADAPSATAIVVAPPSATDRNGDLVPDVCQSPSPDLNGDGNVDAADLAILLGAWGSPAADLNGDGTTGAADLTILLGAWG